MEHSIDNRDIIEQLRVISDNQDVLQEAMDQQFEVLEDMNERLNQLITYLDGGEDEVIDE